MISKRDTVLYIAEFPYLARARLLRAAFGVPEGTEGEVIGYLPDAPLTFVVRFPDAEREVLREDLKFVAIAARGEGSSPNVEAVAPSAESN